MTPDALRALAEAYRFAAEAHCDQRRHGERAAPYVNHCCDVAALASQASDDPEVVMAAVLHDVVEDTPHAIKAIEERFGPGVANLVAWLTDSPEIEALSTPARKAAQAEKIAAAPEAARLVKLCDQISNLSDRIDAADAWPTEKNQAYAAGVAAVMAACAGVSPLLDAMAAEAVAEFERLEPPS